MSSVNYCRLQAVNELKMDGKAIVWLLGSPMLGYDFTVYPREVAEYEAAWQKYLNISKEHLRTPDALFRKLGHDCWFMFQKSVSLAQNNCFMSFL